MAATAADIARLRRMVAESGTTNGYTDTVLSDAILRYPVADVHGETPVDEDGYANTEWVAIYDLNAAAADVWTEKAATLASGYDFNADGGSYSRSQAHAQALKMATYYRSRCYARNTRLVAELNSVRGQDWIGNLAEVLSE